MWGLSRFASYFYLVKFFVYIAILSIGCSFSPSYVCNALTRLVPFQATEIGKAVSGLKKHGSKQIRHLARELVSYDFVYPSLAMDYLFFVFIRGTIP